MILVIDNFDSFTYNLVQLLRRVAPDRRLVVRRNNAVSLADVAALDPQFVIISPGPGHPADAGVSLDIARARSITCSVLGVCLGHQCIGAAWGGQVVAAGCLMHGKSSPIVHLGQGLFEGLPSPLTAARYHSLALRGDSLPACLAVTAWAPDGEVMAIRHVHKPLHGIQFHPESFLSQFGERILSNFLQMATPRLTSRNSPAEADVFAGGASSVRREHEPPVDAAQLVRPPPELRSPFAPSDRR